MLRLTITSISLLVFFVCRSQNKILQDITEASDAIIKVSLLGTGSPQPLMDRFGPSILIEAGGKTLLFDAGRGCLQRLRQLNVEYDKIAALFFTHLHSDHIVGFPDLWLSA